MTEGADVEEAKVEEGEAEETRGRGAVPDEEHGGEEREEAGSGGAEAGGPEEGDASPRRTPVIRVWDRPEDERDPPSQRPQDTFEEARRRRRVG